MIVSFLKRAVTVFGGVLLSFIVATPLAPFFFDGIERVSQMPIPYEGALRITIALAWLFFLWGWLWWLLRKGDSPTWTIFGIVVLAYCATLIIFLGDRNNRLMEEFSWIRYATTLFLVLASWCALILARQQWKERRRSVGMLWVLFGTDLLFAGLDEIFEIHKKIGKATEITSGLPHTVTDYVTVVYALVAALIVAISIRPFLSAYGLSFWRFFCSSFFSRKIRVQDTHAYQWFLCGLLLYVFALGLEFAGGLVAPFEGPIKLFVIEELTEMLASSVLIQSLLLLVSTLFHTQYERR